MFMVWIYQPFGANTSRPSNRLESPERGKSVQFHSTLVRRFGRKASPRIGKDRAMSKKPKAPERPLSARIDKARREGRTQQALELTRALCKYEPTDAHRELLRQVTLERGQQLQVNGMLRDAAIVFGNLLTMGGSGEFRAVVAQRLAACGAVAPALAAMEQVPDPAVRQRVLQNAVDAAV